MTGERAASPAFTDDQAPPVSVARGQSIILDADLGRLFGVETGRLNEQVRRNSLRFDGFAFQLSAKEFSNLRSQNAISSSSHGGRRYRPYAFTEHGVVMAATVLKSDQPSPPRASSSRSSSRRAARPWSPMAPTCHR